MIRNDLYVNVSKELSSHPFLDREDFSVDEIENKEKEPCLSIVYRTDPNFYFIFHIPTAKKRLPNESYENYWYECRMRPGHESVEELMQVGGHRGLLTEIQEWMKRLYEDIVSAPVARQLKAQDSTINQIRERLEQLPNELLSRDEIIQFRDDLDRIKAEFTAQLQQTTTDKTELTGRIDELNNDIQFLKQTLESLTKRQWGEVFWVRARKWTQKYSVAIPPLAAGLRLFKGFLPENLSNTLKNVADSLEGATDVIKTLPNSDGRPKEKE
jgi:archaellum component FlaC